MRLLGLTAFHSVPGREALRAGLLAVCGIAALVLVAVLSGAARPAEGCASGGEAGLEARRAGQAAEARTETAGLEFPLTQPQAAEHGALPQGMGDVSALQHHRPVSPARGRVGFSPNTQAIQRAVRARHDAIVAAMGQRIRWSAVPATDGHAADRPTIVTRPLRGPPAHG
ncbi:MAG TPA: hypothetical protein VF815_38285 [Myxococcaceae bacterium]